MTSDDSDNVSIYDEAIDTILSALSSDLDNGSPDPERLRAFAYDATRRDFAIRLLEALTPSMPEASYWLRWFNGGPSPREVIDPIQFQAGPDTSSRKIKNAAGVYEKLSTKVANARKVVDKASRALISAQQALADAETEEAAALARVQGAILWTILREISKRSDTVFGMGPAWLLTRALSSHVSKEEQQDLDEEALKPIKDARVRQTATIIESLRRFSGDPHFERDVRFAVLKVCVERRSRTDLLETEPAAPPSPLEIDAIVAGFPAMTEASGREIETNG